MIDPTKTYMPKGEARCVPNKPCQYEAKCVRRKAPHEAGRPLMDGTAYHTSSLFGCLMFKPLGHWPVPDKPVAERKVHDFTKGLL